MSALISDTSLQRVELGATPRDLLRLNGCCAHEHTGLIEDRAEQELLRSQRVVLASLPAALPGPL